MIRFRKGSIASPEAPQVTYVTPGVPQMQVNQNAPKPNYKPVQAAPTLHDWQLPAKYRRQPLDPKEVDFINRGGPE
ncbi:hypothetical protein B566_EDAN016078 [Ephemera danica]|nr:hypothetical protein B566_EDAN016078 [Ephemera danica]